MDVEAYVQERLFALQDLKYLEFNRKLIPTVEVSSMIGVRTPALRKLAREIRRMPEAKDYLAILPHRYYEENNLHGFMLEQIKDFDECIAELEKFLPFVDNWQTCDLVTPKVFKSRPAPAGLLPCIKRWLASGHTFTVRYGICQLMEFYMDEEFQPEYPQMVAQIHTEEYYINMAVAWYFATALTKQYESVIAYLEEKRLDLWIHNKTIQKAVESYQVPAERKRYLRGLKR